MEPRLHEIKIKHFAGPGNSESIIFVRDRGEGKEVDDAAAKGILAWEPLSLYPKFSDAKGPH